MTTSFLPYDVSRCHGVQCASAHVCARYLDRNARAANTPIAARLCDTGRESEHYIMPRAEYPEPEEGQTK